MGAGANSLGMGWVVILSAGVSSSVGIRMPVLGYGEVINYAQQLAIAILVGVRVGVKNGQWL